MKIQLASGSPRRADLLNQIGIPFVVHRLDFNEPTIKKGSSPAEAVKTLALAKGKHAKTLIKDSLILTADTVVSFNGQIMGKPIDEADAFSTLEKLSGQKHQVYTGVCLLYKEEEILFYEKTDVYMKELSAETIKAYIKTKEPMDKAGSYGIQGLGGAFVKKIKGDYTNVVGLPIYKTTEHLKKLGFPLDFWWKK